MLIWFGNVFFLLYLARLGLHGRYLKEPFAGSNLTSQDSKLRTLNIRSTIPVRLNSLQCTSHSLPLTTQNALLVRMSFFRQVSSDPCRLPRSGRFHPQTASHRSTTSNLRTGILDLFWDSKKLVSYHCNLASNVHHGFYSPAAFYPFWVGITPPDVLTDQGKASSAFATTNLVLNQYHGSFPSGFVETGLQWDMPNSWPPDQYIALEAPRNLPSNLTTNAVLNGSSFSRGTISAN